MSDFQPTSSQKKAIETVGQSLLVTAAAGSGKTGVLARRAVHLLTDAQPPYRTGIDRLLIVTFTEAAASEMRERIHKELRSRLQQNPDDPNITHQLLHLPAARISTIHAFCRWMIRRWFDRANLDPAAAVMDENQAVLLQRETLEQLLADGFDGKLDFTNEFHQLIEVIGLGEDRSIGKFVLEVARFAESIPDPDRWLNETITLTADDLFNQFIEILQTELATQKHHCARIANQCRQLHPIGQFHADLINMYADTLAEWESQLIGPEDFEPLRLEMAEFKLKATGAPKTTDAPQEDQDAYARTRKSWEHVRGKLIPELKKQFALFTLDEWRQYLRGTEPFRHSITKLIQEFRSRYAAAKRFAGILDFNDLERYAYNLLRNTDNGVAEEVRNMFDHLLVDEFQDINPLQNAILTTASREHVAAREDNLFVVGDVRQSIYRFRLAEPTLFLDRLNAFRTAARPGQTITLKQNFRSRPEILNAANSVFRQLMRKELGGITYDESAELTPGRRIDSNTTPHPVELHVIERKWTAPTGESEKTESVNNESNVTNTQSFDPNDPAEWEPVVREGYLIGKRINDILNEPNNDYTFRDVAILLRTTSFNADRLAEGLAKANVPALAQATGELFAAVEIRDVLALLAIIDNTRQDIPLAAALRSGILGQSLSDNELATIRLRDCDIPFHEVVLQYRQTGPDENIREKLNDNLNRLETLRVAALTEPVAGILNRIYHDHGFLAATISRPKGPARNANLIKLIQIARNCDRQPRAGINRFLRYLEALQDEDKDPGLASPASDAENAVRIISIHSAKGLEFPVVFVADLARLFNFRDARNQLIMDRRLGIAMKSFDPDKMITFPTLTHRLGVSHIEQQTRAEEIRLLYVALTRAKDRLILTASAPLDQFEDAAASAPTDPPTMWSINHARSFLEWLLAALASQPRDAVHWTTANDKNAKGNDQTAGNTLLFRVIAHSQNSFYMHEQSETEKVDITNRLDRIANLESLNITAPFDERAERLIDRVTYDYPTLAATATRAVISASEAKHTIDPLNDPEAPAQSWPAAETTPWNLMTQEDESITPAQRGTAVHRALEFLDFGNSATQSDIQNQINTLRATGRLTQVELESIDVPAIHWFTQTDLGQRITTTGENFHRELTILAALSAAEFDPTLDPDNAENILVRGILDGLLTSEKGYEIIDYKTDRVTDESLGERIALYDRQLAVYARAVEQMTKKAVTHRWLVFLHNRQCINLNESTRSTD
jgi:ATP-dependent helicase/nuclease subunit A